MSNSVDPDETAHLDLRCLQKPIIIAYGSETVNTFLFVYLIRAFADYKIVFESPRNSQENTFRDTLGKFYFIIKIYVVFTLESPHRGDTNKYS